MALNVVLLIVCVCIVLALLFYLFYWNRLLAFLLSLVLRLALWNQGESSLWLEFGAIHFSTLTGRILIKDLRYHSSNQTFRIVKLQLSWRYWLRQPAEEEDLSHARVIGEEANGKHGSPLGCRVHISLQGLEWFMYNRTGAFDNIVSQLHVDLPATPAATPLPDGGASVRKVFSRTSVFHDSSILGPPVSLVSSIYRRTPTLIKRAVSWVRSQMPSLDPKDLLPFSLEVSKGAITIGNASTPNLLVAQFQRAEGTYGIVEARSKHDLYKQVLNIKLQNLSMSYVENEDFTSPMAEVGRKTHERVNRTDSAPLRRASYLSYPTFQRVWQRLKLWSSLSIFDRTSRGSHHSVPVPHPQTWGRRRQHKSLDEETPLGADFATLEYAIERKILEASVVELLYYADVVGVVPPLAAGQENQDESMDPFDIGNGDLPPEWGIDLVIRDGFIRYGPWADRQRTILQHAFFPPMFANAHPTPRLKPGDMRIWTGLKIFIELRDGVTLQLPFRESSKNWQWDGQVDVKDRPRKREAASIHLRAGDSSTISYIVPMIASAKGYISLLEVHLDTVTVTSSLNDIRLLTAETCRIRSSLPAPLKWNGVRQWTFAISLRQPCFYLLRDHINMFTDLAKDWSSGPPSDYYTFTPMIYVIDLDMHNYTINLYVNDHNIIDKPLIREDNALLTLRGTHFTHGAYMPFTKYRPEATTVSFWLEAPDVFVDLSLPRWNISGLYQNPDRSQVGHIGMLNMNGSFRYCAEVKEENVDQLKLDFTGRDVIYKAFGWTIRYFMILRDNYFGSFTHFSTLTEYLSKRNRGDPLGDPMYLQYREGQSNAMQVTMGLEVDNGLMILPAGYPGYEQYNTEYAHNSLEDLGPCLFLSLPSLQLHLRSNDYYMEMSVNLDTISGRISEHCYNASVFTSASDSVGAKREEIVIDGINITANRLFGHRPATATYVCIWEIHLGDIKAAINAYDARLLSAVGSSFALNFSDPLNAPAKEYAIPSDPDVTFLQVRIDSVNVVWTVGNAAAELTLQRGLRIDMNDLAGKTFRKVTGIRLPEATAKLLLASKQDRGRWIEAADARLDVDIDIYSSPPGWQESAQLQTEFITEQDATTGRVKILYSHEDTTISSQRLRPGRGNLDNDFYLPQIRIPRLHPMESAREHLVTRLPSLREDLSESDIEPLPDAVRDARVADLRPANIGTEVLSDGDQELSSGDESDDGDSSDWTTDYPDTIDDASFESSWPSIKQYGSLCRHYEGRYVTRPSMWPSSPFMLTRDTSRICRYSEYLPSDIDEELAARLASVWSQSVYDDNESVDKTTFRIRSKDGIQAWITPLILPALGQLLSDLGSNPLSPELRFDALTIKYIQSFKSRPGPRGSVNTFDVHFPSIQIRSLQLVNVSARQERANGEPKQTPPAGDLFVTIVEVSAGELDFRARSSPGSDVPHQSDVALAMSSFSAALLSKSPARGSYKQNPRRLCHLSVGPTVASVLRRDVALSLGFLSSDIGHSGPDFVLATTVVVARYFWGIVLAQRQMGGYPSDQQVIHGVLACSKERSIVDPLSTIQPSYLVQQGLPDKLRKDTTFKFLVYLRNCLRFLNEHEREVINASQPDVSVEEVVDILQSQWFGTVGEDDSYDSSQQSLLQELLRGDRKADPVSEPAPWESHYDSASLTITGMRLSIRHPTDALESEFLTGPLAVVAHQQLVTLVQAFASNASKSFPHISSKDRERRNLLRASLCITLDRISSTVHPQAVEFMQIVLRDYRHHSVHLRAALRQARALGSPTSLQSRSPPTPTSPRTPPPTVSIDCTLYMRAFTFTAAAEQLVVRFKNSNITYASSFLGTFPSREHPAWDVSINQSLMFGGAAFEACSSANLAQPKEQVLASLTFAEGKVNVLLQQDVHRNTTFRVLTGLQKMHLDVPRSALRLYHFIEDWRADYLPGIDATVRALLAELRRGTPKAPSRASSHTSHSPKQLNFQVQASVTSVKATLQVMHGTWVSWEVRETIAFLLNDTRRKGAHQIGLQMGPHVFAISRSRAGSQPSPSSSIRLELPTATLRGRFDSTGLHGLALLEFFHLTVRPSDWDTLLSVQQKSGQDFNDLIHIIEQTRQKRPTPTSPAHASEQGDKKSSFKLHGSLKMKGFRIGLEGLTSMLFLECDDISGGVSNQGRSLWHVKLSDLALSLASQLSIGAPSHKDRRSAFVRVDIEASMGRRSYSSVQHLEVSITKIHAVMQPSSIGELGDFIDHLQAEVLIRKEQRASELEEFKEKTRSLMKSLDVKIGEQKPSEKSLLDLYTVSLVIKNMGVAFPLTLARDLQMPRTGSQDESSVRAFLFSIKTLQFGTQLGESGQASMSGFSFQFISRFRQGNAADFSAENHRTRNRLVYPEMTAHVRSERIADSRRVCIGAQVSGFVLDVDSTIPDFVSSLLDVYRRGKDRVERLASSAPRSSLSTEAPPLVEPIQAENHYGALPTSNILASLTFASGKVRMHSKESSSHQVRRPISTLLYGRGDDTNGAEEFNLPEVSVWGEFRATPALQKLASTGKAAEPSTLVFKSTIHSSQNTLRPTLLPFLTELMAKIEDHMRTPNWRGPQSSPGPRPHGLLPPIVPISIPAATAEEPPARSVDPVSSMKISFSLRIDQSKLLLTCRPDANVIGGLHWDSGGFMINIAPGARRVSFTGTVGGLTVSLKHGFLSEDCVKLDARNLNFTIGFAKLQPKDGYTMSSVSVVLDTQFAGGIRFSRLQDVLCFKAVWLDRIPAFSGGSNLTPTERPSSNTSALPTPNPATTTNSKQELTTAVLIRLRRVELDVDLGQSISTIKLTMDNTLVRTKITETLSELSLAIGHFSIVASGNLAGYADMPDFQFQTVRRNNSHEAKEAGGRMLDLSMTSGIFTVKLDSEYHELIQYRAEPITIYIYDDWSRIASAIPSEDRRVTLDFVVSGTDVLAIMTVGTVPKLVSYVNKFRTNLDAQREGASRESKAFRMASAPKPDNPLSAVANAMFKSARSRLKEHETGLSYVIGQRMSLRLKLLRLIVFPRSMRDPELAQFVGEDIHARLHRLIQTEEDPAKRELQLYFSGITISKVSQLHHSLIPKEQSLDSRDWLSALVSNSPEAIIFGLPSMDMQMSSEETLEAQESETRRVLGYDFSSSFSKDGVKDAEDIYISLNMSLYAWLTVLRKTFAREMEQVQLSADTRAVGIGSGAQAALALRKKQDSTASATPSPVDREDGSIQGAMNAIRTRPRGRGSISRSIPLAIHSVDDISTAVPHSHAIPKSPALPVPSTRVLSPSDTVFSHPDLPIPTALSSVSGSKEKKSTGLVYTPHNRKIERLTMRQLGEATPDVMHPFFMKKAGFNLEDSLPQYVHEYATMPTEEIMKALLKLYTKQLTRNSPSSPLSPEL
ncbi:hypothetical protein C8Q80DRAFT_1355680 [Daedaleopsis nitida]|nr:hypothetical protein C8Q80DRAFT_1355680 [Daedaleopsis nitida]